MSIQILKHEDSKDFPGIPEEYFSDKDKSELLFAFENNKFAGGLKGTFITENLFYINEIKIAEKDLTEVVHSAFCNYLYSRFLPTGTEILSWEKPETETINIFLEKSGFKISKKKVYVEKNLEKYISPYENPFTFKSLAETGKDYFIKMMSQASIGDPFEDSSGDPEKDFQELIDYSGEKYNPDWWKIAFLNDVPAGVVLPQLFAYGDEEGSLFYLGIIPEFRGKGLGKIIHSAGLEFLSKNNVLKYKGSTDTANEPMINIFRKNECLQTGTQVIFKTS